MEYPCAGRVLALDGRDGSTLWDVGTQVEVFAIQCGKLDINGDGHMDCIVAGRMATLHGIDPIKGKRRASPSVSGQVHHMMSVAIEVQLCTATEMARYTIWAEHLQF